MCNCTSADARFRAGPESILPIVVMDSGLARGAFHRAGHRPVPLARCSLFNEPVSKPLTFPCTQTSESVTMAHLLHISIFLPKFRSNRISLTPLFQVETIKCGKYFRCDLTTEAEHGQSS